MGRCSDVVVWVAGFGKSSGLRCFVVGVHCCAGEASLPVTRLDLVDLTILTVADSIDVGRLFCLPRVPLLV